VQWEKLKSSSNYCQDKEACQKGNSVIAGNLTRCGTHSNRESVVHLCQGKTQKGNRATQMIRFQQQEGDGGGVNLGKGSGNACFD